MVSWGQLFFTVHFLDLKLGLGLSWTLGLETWTWTWTFLDLRTWNKSFHCKNTCWPSWSETVSWGHGRRLIEQTNSTANEFTAAALTCQSLPRERTVSYKERPRFTASHVNWRLGGGTISGHLLPLSAIQRLPPYIYHLWHSETMNGTSVPHIFMLGGGRCMSLLCPTCRSRHYRYVGGWDGCLLRLTPCVSR